MGSVLGTSTQGTVRGTQCRQITDTLTEPSLDGRKGQCVCHVGHGTSTAGDGHQKGALKHSQMWGRQGASLFQEPHSDLKKILEIKNNQFSSVQSLSRVWLLATPWTADFQAPLSMGFSRQEYWSGVPLLYAGDHQIHMSIPAFSPELQTEIANYLFVLST